MNRFSIIAAIPMVFAIQSCGGDNDLPDDNGSQPVIGENKVLEGTKWTTRSFDFDIADDGSWA